MSIESVNEAIRVIASLAVVLDKSRTYHGRFSSGLVKALDELNVIRTHVNVNDSTTLQRDVILSLTALV